jgi:hypothetical protein
MNDRSDVTGRIDADLRALRAVTARDLPTWQDTERALRASAANPQTEGGSLMLTWRRFRRHPRTLAGLCATAVAAALLLLPISYQRTVGHTVRLSLSGPAPVRPLAKGLRQALHAESVQVAASPEGVTLTAQVAVRSRAEVQRRADAFASVLARQGHKAQVAITPRTEQVSGRVYAMALEKVIEIRVDMTGKSARQIEDEIREQLRSQGVTDPEVQVERSGEQTRVEIGAQVGERELKVVRLSEGTDRIEVKIGDLDTRREPGMTDDQLREKIERQLRERGLEPTVTVHGDEIQIRATKRTETN